MSSNLARRAVARPAQAAEPQRDERERPQGEPEHVPEAQPETKAEQHPSQKAVAQAQQRAMDESQVIGGRPNPRNPDAKTHKVAQTRPPIFDVTNMTGEDAKKMLKKLLEQRANQVNFAIAKAIRWNNGTEPNVQGGELVSARDTGSISVYGFARRPLTLYAGQWMALARYMPDILTFLKSNLDDINVYVEKRLGNKSKNISAEDVQAALQLFCIEQKGE